MAEPTSQSVMEKFEFYFLALIFTLLGASIQTNNKDTHSKDGASSNFTFDHVRGSFPAAGTHKCSCFPHVEGN